MARRLSREILSRNAGAEPRPIVPFRSAGGIIALLPNGREFDFEQMLIPKWQNQDWRDACLCRDAPDDLVACIGSEGQRLYVIPSLHLIVVRQADGGSFSDAHFLRLLLGRERQ